MIMKSITTIIPLVKFDICSSELESMLVDHIISEICNVRIWKVILISDSTILLDYKHRFIKSQHVVHSRSQARTSSRYLHRVLKCNWFSLVECWINFKILNSNGVNTLVGLSGPCSELIYHDDTVYEGWIESRFILVHKSVLGIMQGCTRDLPNRCTMISHGIETICLLR